MRIPVLWLTQLTSCALMVVQWKAAKQIFKKKSQVL